MKRFSALVPIVLLAPAFFAAAGEAEPPSIDDLAWMAGHWRGTIGEAVIEEVWLTPAGSQMIGVNRTLVDGSAVAFENLRIEAADDGIVFLASPGGRCPATPFRLETLKGEYVVFANPAHDFPQRIEYRREGDVLHARIEGAENGEIKSVAWSWTRRNTK